MRIVTVLRSGGDFTPKHVQVLAKQIEQYAFPHTLEVLSDIDVPGVIRIPLTYNWPGWWSKMEVMRPDVEGDILYFDLDTIVIDSLEPILKTKRLTMLRDFYRDGTRHPAGLLESLISLLVQPRNFSRNGVLCPEGLQSSVMFLPEAERTVAWNAWITSPCMYMEKFQRGGDQAFLETIWLNKADRWQDILPRQFVSYKAHVRGKTFPLGVRVIIFHGQPRPWAVPEFQHVYQGQ